MAREAFYFGFLRNGDALTIPLYNVAVAECELIRMDNSDATGSVLVKTIIPKSYNYDSMVLYQDVPQAFYGFPLANQTARVPLSPFNQSLSTAAAPKESLSGRTLTLAGGNLVNGNYTTSRLTGYYLMVPPTVQAQDTYTGISAQDNAGGGWSIDGWIFRNSAGLSTFYFESNAGLTSYFQFFIDAGGHMNIGHSGVTAFTGTKVIGTGAWHHIALVYNGTQIIEYLDNSASTAVAYTHGTYSAIALNRLNHGAPNVHYTQSLGCYAAQLTAADINRHYLQIAGADFESGMSQGSGATVGQGGGVTVVFCDTAAIPTSVTSGGSGGTGIAMPLLGVGYITATNNLNNSQWEYLLHIIENEAVQ